MSTHLYIVRHGEAEPNPLADKTRNLTDNGKHECNKIGLWIANQCKLFDLVLISPYTRAIQTWHMLAAAGIRAQRFEYLNELQPDSNVDDCVNVIQAYAQGLENVLVISHLPLVCFLVDELVAEACPLFATGTTAHLELVDFQHKGHIQEIVSPSQLTGTPIDTAVDALQPIK
ncbi:phosphohistidine phosphatase SixA [Gayadomonas joobiniege]|uniref:phosphohistidine phosphatase SixA n=1 Tax=Gayadomonas joobiniege TaxID=1234606 RepID=UPI0003760D9E|nr:phosphohistidine phosphatase SixA [Gayadomonas joobiniege]